MEDTLILKGIISNIECLPNDITSLEKYHFSSWIINFPKLTALPPSLQGLTAETWYWNMFKSGNKIWEAKYPPSSYMWVSYVPLKLICLRIIYSFGGFTIGKTRLGVFSPSSHPVHHSDSVKAKKEIITTIYNEVL